MLVLPLQCECECVKGNAAGLYSHFLIAISLVSNGGGGGGQHLLQQHLPPLFLLQHHCHGNIYHICQREKKYMKGGSGIKERKGGK